MNIGKKIKELRIEKLMTQSELAGGEITRNMLSRIENGAANPSLSTIIHLASKLGVPAGYLLSEGDEEFIYHKTNAIKNIRRAYTDGHFELCRDLCLSSFDEYDDELELILADCCFEIAEEQMRSGRLYEARDYLDEAMRHAEKTMFDCSAHKNGEQVMFEILKEISPSLDSNEDDVEIDDGLLYPAVHKKLFCKYLAVLLDITKYSAFEADFKRRHKRGAEGRDMPLLLHLKARRLMSEERYSDALKMLKEAMNSDIGDQRLILYFTCADTEECCRELEDYKGAYEFSQNKIEILEHMLIER